MTIEQLFAKHVDILQLAFSIHQETSDRDLHVWLADHDAGHVHDDASLWQSTSCDAREIGDPILCADLQAFWYAQGLDAATDNAIWFRNVEVA